MNLLWYDWRGVVHPPRPPLPTLRVTPLASLTRWDATQQPDYEHRAAGKEEEEKKPADPSDRVQFEFHPLLNHKIILCQGDVLGMQVDALVHSSNERLSDIQVAAAPHSTPGSLAWRVSNYCGPVFQADCARLVSTDGGVSTGESTLLPSGELATRHRGPHHVVLTVSPRYSERYAVAAANALHGCFRHSLELALDAQLGSIAFPLVHAAHKAYPLDEAAHIACRTLRKFLERYGRDTIHTVVLCFQRGVPVGLPGAQPPVQAQAHAQHEAADGSGSYSAVSGSAPPTPPTPLAPPVSPDEDVVYAVYERILPLYFPRSTAEEQRQLTHLPRDTGNSLGETDVPERQLRIGEFIARGPRPFDEVDTATPHATADQPQLLRDPVGLVAAASTSTFSRSPDVYVSPAHRSSDAAAADARVRLPSHPAAVVPTQAQYPAADEYPPDRPPRRVSAAPPPPAIVCRDSGASSFTAVLDNPDTARSRTLSMQGDVAAASRPTR